MEAGIQQLPLPHRLSLWGLQPGDYAQQLPNDQPLDVPGILPMPIPEQIRAVLARSGVLSGTIPPKLRFLKLTRMKVSTKEESRTSISTSVKNYRYSDRLHNVRVSKQLWTALVGFAVGPGEIRPEGPNEALAAEEMHLHTYQNNMLPVPPLHQQEMPIFNLWSWFIMHLTTSPMVNSELSVQDEVRRQLLLPMNNIIESRYGTIATAEAQASEPPHRFTPTWNRYVEEHRYIRNEGNPENPARDSTAGIPDFILYLKNKAKATTMIWEVKTAWSYTSHHIRTMISHHNYPLGRGIVDWDRNEIVNNILRQLWSEMHEFNTKFGIWTNGAQIIVAIDTTDITAHPIENQLTFSLVQDISGGSYIYQGIAGICFASIEYSLLSDDHDKLNFINALCPPNSRLFPNIIQQDVNLTVG